MIEGHYTKLLEALTSLGFGEKEVSDHLARVGSVLGDPLVEYLEDRICQGQYAGEDPRFYFQRIESEKIDLYVEIINLLKNYADMTWGFLPAFTDLADEDGKKIGKEKVQNPVDQLFSHYLYTLPSRETWIDLYDQKSYNIIRLFVGAIRPILLTRIPDPRSTSRKRSNFELEEPSSRKSTRYN